MFLERFSAYGFRKDALASSYAMAENVFAVTQGGIDSALNIDIIDGDALRSEQIATPSKKNPKAVKMISSGRCLTNTHYAYSMISANPSQSVKSEKSPLKATVCSLDTITVPTSLKKLLMMGGI